jgi:hypothetical protein
MFFNPREVGVRDDSFSLTGTKARTTLSRVQTNTHDMEVALSPEPARAAAAVHVLLVHTMQRRAGQSRKFSREREKQREKACED